MELFVALLLVFGFVYWVFRAGKREGSRKGFHAGRTRRWRRFR